MTRGVYRKRECCSGRGQELELVLVYLSAATCERHISFYAASGMVSTPYLPVTRASTYREGFGKQGQRTSSADIGETRARLQCVRRWLAVSTRGSLLTQR